MTFQLSPAFDERSISPLSLTATNTLALQLRPKTEIPSKSFRCVIISFLQRIFIHQSQFHNCKEVRVNRAERTSLLRCRIHVVQIVAVMKILHLQQSAGIPSAAITRVWVGECLETAFHSGRFPLTLCLLKYEYFASPIILIGL